MDKESKFLSSEDFIERLIKEGPFLPGDEGEFLEGDQIDWINSKLIKEGQDFVRKNAFSVNLAHFFSLLVGFSFKSLTTILLRTGKFTGVENSMIRFLETEMHITNLYESEILTQKDKGFKDIQKVRKMHALALKRSLRSDVKLFEVRDVPNAEKIYELISAMKKDLECFKMADAPYHLMTYYPKVLMSQFDMVMTQYGFVGSVYLFSEMLGIRDTKGMDGFIHLWAVIGRLMGIQDKFNIGLHPDREIFAKIFKRIAVAGLMGIDLTTVVLQENFCDALSSTAGTTKLKARLYYCFTMAGKTMEPRSNGENIYKLMSWSDVFNLRVFQFGLFLIYHFDFIREFVNKSMKIALTNKRRKVFGVKNGEYNMYDDSAFGLGRRIIF